MNKLPTIILREFSTRVMSKSFILLTVLMPFLFAALVFVPMWLGQIEGNDQQTIAVVDETGRYFDSLESNDQYNFVRYDKVDDGMRSDTSSVSAVLHITGDLTADPGAATLASRKEIQLNMRDYIEGAIDRRVHRERLESYNISGLDSIINDIEQPFTLHTVKWTAEGEDSNSLGDIAIVLGIMSAMLIYMFVMAYGSMVMSGVLEEKTNRIMEIMVSSVKPFELMMGKIIGIALVGLLQIAIWGAMFGGIMGGIALFCGGDVAEEVMAAQTPNLPGGAGSAVLAAAAEGGDAEAMIASAAQQDNGMADFLTAMGGVPWLEVGIVFLLMFIGGYLLYASFFAAIGASVNSQEDTSQFMTPVILVMVFALYAAMGSIGNTDGPLAFWTSLFPLTSPIVLLIRIPFGVPLWQELLSIGLLYATALGMVWVAGKIYRVGILMYGKKPTLKEMWKWLTY